MDSNDSDAPVNDDDEAQAHAAPLDTMQLHDNMVCQ